MIAICSHPLSSPLNQLAGLMILGGGLLYAYSFYDLYQHGALGSLWLRIIDPTHGWFPLWDWPPAKWVYLLVAAPASYILGTFLWGSGRIIYPHYAGIEALADQRLGGLIMWIQGWMFLMASMLVFFRGYHPEQEPA